MHSKKGKGDRKIYILKDKHPVDTDNPWNEGLPFLTLRTSFFPLCISISQL